MTDTKQPEALRLASEISASGRFANEETIVSAAVELRRLHAENEALRAQISAPGTPTFTAPTLAPVNKHSHSIMPGFVYAAKGAIKRDGVAVWLVVSSPITMAHCIGLGADWRAAEVKTMHAAELRKRKPLGLAPIKCLHLEAQADTGEAA